MNNSKKTGIAVGSILIVCIAALAFSTFQGNRAEEASAAKQVAARQKIGGPKFNPQQMLADLNLTEEQKQKLAVEQKSMQEDFKRMQGMSESERMAQMPSMMQKRREAMEKVLTPEQAAKLREKMPQMPNGEMPPGGMPPFMGGAQ